MRANLRKVFAVILMIFGIYQAPAAFESLFLAAILGWVGDASSYSLQDQITTRGLNLLYALGIASLLYSGFVLFKGKYGKLGYISLILTSLYLISTIGFFVAGFIYYTNNR